MAWEVNTASSIACPLSNRFLTADDPQQNHHNGNDQKNVNKPANGVGRDQAKKPQNEQYRCDRIKHDGYPYVCTEKIDRADLTAA
jgi:hypothetical protein